MKLDEVNAMLWSNTTVPGAIRIDRVATVFEVWADQRLPFAKFRVKILERSPNDFVGVADVAIRNPRTRNAEFTSGLGHTIEETLKDTLNYFFREIENNKPDRDLTEDDFVWSAPEDF
jgi:hypothetical protein